MTNERPTYANEDGCRKLGCTCEWHGGGSIIVFDRACPILRHHRVYEPANWKDSRSATEEGDNG